MRGLAAGGLVLAAIAALLSAGTAGVGGAAAAYYYYCPGGGAGGIYGYCPPTDGTLIVRKIVVNDNGGTAVPADFSMRINGVTVSPPNPFPGSSAGTSKTVSPGSYTVTETGPVGYDATFSAGCSGTIDAGETITCTVTNDDTPAHFKAYDVDQNTPVHATEPVLLTDQFGTETVQVAATRLLLTPVEKRRTGMPAEPIPRPEEHQVCYVVSGGRNQNTTVRVTNQFVTGATLRVDGPTRLCAPASKSLTGPPTSAPIDTQHYKCYAVLETSPRPEEIVTLVDQFGTEQVGVRAASLLCNPVTKQRVGRPPEVAPRPDEHLVCYTLRRIQAFAARRVHTRDQFVTQQMRVKAPLYLCVPSEKLP